MFEKRLRGYLAIGYARGDDEEASEEPIGETTVEWDEEATIDAYDRWEQVTGFYTMLEEHLEVPFKTCVLGLDVTVEEVELSNAGEIAAICMLKRFRQRISILDLPLPAPPTKGSEWIEAYRRWSSGK